MGKRKEFEFAELPVDKIILESFANAQSAYHSGEDECTTSEQLGRFRQKLLWHVGHSLSGRQHQVIRAFLAGCKERDIARKLGITQQVVNIYKQRAIKKLQRFLTA